MCLPTPPDTGTEHNEHEKREVSPLPKKLKLVSTPSVLPTPPPAAASSVKASSSFADAIFFDDDDPFDGPCSPLDSDVDLDLLHTKGRGRGKHTRTKEMKKRRKWLPQVQQHMADLESGKLMGQSQCSQTCKSKRCNEMVAKRVAKICAAASFGEAALTQDWSRIRSNHAAVQHWFQMAHELRVVDGRTGLLSHVDYKLDGMPVCLGAWAQFHGIPDATASSIHRQLLKGGDVWNAGLRKEYAMAMRSQRADLSNASTAWWYNRLECYEMVVSKYHYIQHPRDICWLDVYENEFVPEMQNMGYIWRVPLRKRLRFQECGDERLAQDEGAAAEINNEESVDDEASSSCDEVDGKAVGSISTWYRGRARALKQMAVEHLGEGHQPFKFVSRAKHSAYVRSLYMCMHDTSMSICVKPPTMYSIDFCLYSPVKNEAHFTLSYS